MKIRGKFIILFLVFIAAFVMFIVSRKQYYGDLLSIKNVETLADGETGLEKCYDLRGYCRNADGTVWTDLLNIYQ